jgi:predicted nuclease with RNAse H fold
MRQKTNVTVGQLLGTIRLRHADPVSVGIDLTGSERRASGFCVLAGNEASLSLFSSDADLIAAVHAASPAIVAIDSSLGLPRGRCCADDTCECRKYGIMRECERILRKRGIHVYPTLIPSMQQLTLRGMALAGRLRAAGYAVIECYPGATQDILGFPRKKVDLQKLERSLLDMGIASRSDRDPVTHDQIDALTAALAGYFYLAGRYEAIGNEDEGYLILPQIEG